MTFTENSTKSSDAQESVREIYPLGMSLPSVTVEVTPERRDAFGYVSTDQNPLHYLESYAANTIFGKCIAHGMLSASFISAIFGNIDGAVYLKQSLEFLKPVYIGETITATAIVQGYGKKNGSVEFHTYCKNQNYEEVIRGEATIWFPHLTS